MRACRYAASSFVCHLCAQLRMLQRGCLLAEQERRVHSEC